MLEQGPPGLHERGPAPTQPDGNAQLKGQIAREGLHRAQLRQAAQEGGHEAAAERS